MPITRVGGTSTGRTAMPRPGYIDDSGNSLDSSWSGAGLDQPADDILDRSGTGVVTTPTEPSSGDEGNAYRPRETAPEQPTTPIAPGGVPYAGLPGEGAQAMTPEAEAPLQKSSTQPQPPQATGTPAMPENPTPVAGEPPAPFVPMAPPPAIYRKSVTGAPQLPSSNLLGGAGGLMGGGLGVPSYAGGTSDVSALIKQLLARGGY